MRVDEASRKAVEAHAYCASATCLNLREKHVKFRGFNPDLDNHLIGFCSGCYEWIQLGFIDGSASSFVAELLGAVAEPPEDGGP